VTTAGDIMKAIAATTPANDQRAHDLAQARTFLDQGDVAGAIRMLQDVRTAPNELRIVEAAQLFEPLPPVPYLVPRLDLCPGAPMLVAGYGFSGKTIAMQSLAVSIATGRPAWGDFHVVRRGRVVHVDFEQGLRLTAERYQRLARGSGLDLQDLEGLLALVPLPRVSLATGEGVELLRRVADGAALVIVDSLRACAPEVEENSSEVRRVLDGMLDVSESTGAAFSVVHHARKPSGDQASGGKFSIRGSGAIFDACSSVLVFEAEKGQPTKVSHEKARTSGRLEDDFMLRIEDVDDGARGLKVRTEAAEKHDDARATARRDLTAERVLRSVVEHPGVAFGALRSLTGLKTHELAGALEVLKTRGRVFEEGGARGARLFTPGLTAATSSEAS
jgi:hypothetical protein